MKPVDQTTFGVPGGNCFSACVASLLEMPIDDVPYFMGDCDEDGGGGDWFDRFTEWLRGHGFYPVCLENYVPDGLHILSGKSPRHPETQTLHSVVANGAAIVHDPHPSRAGILDRRDVVLLIPLDPARHR